MKTKLTTVTVTFRGRKENIFCEGVVCEDGKTRVDPKIITAALKKLGCEERGQTYSMG